MFRNQHGEKNETIIKIHQEYDCIVKIIWNWVNLSKTEFISRSSIKFTFDCRLCKSQFVTMLRSLQKHLLELRLSFS